MASQERKNSVEQKGIQVQQRSAQNIQGSSQNSSVTQTTTQKIVTQVSSTQVQQQQKQQVQGSSSTQSHSQSHSQQSQQREGQIVQQLISGGPISHQSGSQQTQQLISTRGVSSSNNSNVQGNKISYLQSPQNTTQIILQQQAQQQYIAANTSNSSLQQSFQSFTSQPQRIIVQDGGQSRAKAIQQSAQKVLRSESPVAQRKIIQNLSSPPNHQLQFNSSPQQSYVIATTKQTQEVVAPVPYRQVIQMPYQIQEKIVEKIVYIEDKQSKETIHELEQRIQELIVENNKLKNKPPQIQIEEKTIYLEDDTKVKHLEQKMTILINEIDKLNRVVNEKAGECDQLRQVNYEYESHIQNKIQENEYWRQKCSEYEKNQKEFSLQIQQYRIEIENFTQNINIRQEEIQNLKNINASSESNLRSLNARIQNYEERTQQLLIEIEKLSLTIKSKGEEIESLRFRYTQLESQVINQYQPQIQDYQARQDSLRQSIRTVETQNSKLKIENDRLAFLNEEVRRLESIILQKNQEVEEWKSRNYQLTVRIEEYSVSENRIHILANEIDRLQKENRALEEDLSLWRYKYAEYSHLEQINKDLLINQVLHCAEIESLRNQLTTRLRESVQIKTVEVPIRTSQRTYETTTYSIDGDMTSSQGYRSGYQAQSITRQF